MECVFFFKAEDGIRDGHVTGVQTCALPIWRRKPCKARRRGILDGFRGAATHPPTAKAVGSPCDADLPLEHYKSAKTRSQYVQIGRASCRERGEIPVVYGGVRQE